MTRNLNRRALLASGAMAGVGAAWTSLSESWSARFLRARMAEFGQEVAPAPHTPSPAAWNDNAVTLAWLGHATVLVNFYGLRLITDPVLFTRIGVDLGIGSLGPQRLVRCALAPDSLPEIDLVLVSHAHFDHLDTPSLAAIRGRPAAVMAVGTADLLPRRGYAGVHELRWNETITVQTPRGEVRGAGARGEALGRASRPRHPSRLHRLGPRTRRAAAADRRRHRATRRCSATIAASGRSRRR